MQDICVTIYTNDGCPRCEVLKSKLSAKGIAYTEVRDFDRNELAQHGFNMMPVMQHDNNYMDFATANKWINGR